MGVCALLGVTAQHRTVQHKHIQLLLRDGGREERRGEEVEEVEEWESSQIKSDWWGPILAFPAILSYQTHTHPVVLSWHWFHAAALVLMHVWRGGGMVEGGRKEKMEVELGSSQGISFFHSEINRIYDMIWI
jgi:hypothetical protein